MTLNEQIDLARVVAQTAHAGQKRNSGGDYFTEHVEQVAAAVEPRLKPIAYLHDVVEDTSVTLNDLKGLGFDQYITDAVELLTHAKGAPNVGYWAKIATNKDATTVKLADIRNNLAGQPSEHAKEKYAKALAFFKKLGYEV